MKHFILLVISLIWLPACDCVQTVEAVVLDKKTLEPIDSVRVGKEDFSKVYDQFSNAVLTDLQGHFRFSSISGGLSGCPDVELYFAKKGYATFKQQFSSHSMGDTVYLELGKN